MAEGKTGNDGRTERHHGDEPENIKVLIGEGDWKIFSPDTAITMERDEDDIEEEGSEND